MMDLFMNARTHTASYRHISRCTSACPLTHAYIHVLLNLLYSSFVDSTVNIIRSHTYTPTALCAHHRPVGDNLFNCWVLLSLLDWSVHVSLRHYPHRSTLNITTCLTDCNRKRIHKVSRKWTRWDRERKECRISQHTEYTNVYSFIHSVSTENGSTIATIHSPVPCVFSQLINGPLDLNHEGITHLYRTFSHFTLPRHQLTFKGLLMLERMIRK